VARGQVRARNWHIFKSPDGDFTLAFPEKAKLQDVTEGPVTMIRGYGVTSNDGTNFSVNFHDIGGDPKLRENNEWNSGLEETLSAFDRSQNVQVVQTHRLAKNIIESELWQTLPNNAGKINYLRRSIMRRSRVYTLACGPVINGKVVNKSLCRRFFGSMRFIGNTNLNRPDRRPDK